MSTGEALKRAAEALHTAPLGDFDVPQEARDKARELGWEEGLIEMAMSKGHSLQEVWQALRGGIDGATAKNFLAGGSIVRPEFNWMKVPTEWGLRLRASDPEMGLTIEDL